MGGGPDKGGERERAASVTCSLWDGGAKWENVRGGGRESEGGEVTSRRGRSALPGPREDQVSDMTG